MRDSITDVEGILVGHAQDFRGGSGCTVVLCPGGAVTAVDTRGGAPGTRETDCLRAENFVPCAHAVFLTGGSAFGLDCAGGIMRWLEERRIGIDVGATHVPIVPGAVLNDLAFTEGKCRPDAAMGYRACENATAEESRQGNIGAGTGACIGRLAGNSIGTMKGGLGTASLSVGDLVVGAIVAVNCNGDVRDPETGETLAGTFASGSATIAGSYNLMTGAISGYSEGYFKNTTIGVVATNAALTKATANRVAVMAQDGLARAIDPIHTLGDGDVVFCMSSGTVQTEVNRVGAIAAWVMARAIANAVKNAETLNGVPAWKDLPGSSHAR